MRKSPKGKAGAELLPWPKCGTREINGRQLARTIGIEGETLSRYEQGTLLQ
jgi:hypothetical protein